MNQREQVVKTLMTLHGGPEKLDCWLTVAADRMPGDSKYLPPGVRPHLGPAMAWMERPYEVLDHILDNLERLGAWKYYLRRGFGAWEIVDALSGHVMEATDGLESLQSLATKYRIDLHVPA